MAKSTIRDIVLERHNSDKDTAFNFVNNKWPWINDGNVVTSDMVCCSVSTTKHSTMLILSLGLDSCFTYGTYSADPNNPWLIYTETASENKPLAQHIANTWQNMATPGQRDQVDQIAKHVVYLLVGDQFILKNLVCDEDNNVRLKVEDIEIWSHPPRDEALMAVLLDNPTFKQKEGNVRAEARGYINVRGKQGVPPANVTRKLESLREKFHLLYGFYEELQPKDIPDSYKWPTLQLGQNCNFQSGQAAQNVQLQRYGDTFAGVYGPRDNKTHHKFPALGVQPRGLNLPTRENVFNDLLAAEKLNYADVFNKVTPTSFAGFTVWPAALSAIIIVLIGVFYVKFK